MAKYKIAWLPGDGVGKDVTDAVRIVLEELSFDAEYVEAEVGWECWEKYRDPLPPQTIEVLKETDCCMFGAITSKPNVPGYRSPIVRMRQLFQLYANMRPIKAFRGNPLNYRDDIDMVIFRENTEGLYLGIEYTPIPEEMRGLPGMEKIKDFEETSVSLRVFTRTGCRRLIRKAFEYAREHGRKKVTIVHKANVIRHTDGMFLEVADEVHRDFPEIEMDTANVDAVAMWLIKNPDQFDVIAVSNMFGDIISDEAAQLVGGLGFASSANLGDDYAVFEPTHGSAPKYAGQYKVNPCAAILACRLMLEWLGERDMAAAVEHGVAQVVSEGTVKTYDMGGSSSTLDVARAIAKAAVRKLG